ncbi:MAG: putative O-antigen polymerase [Acidobacteriaceae bacterium]|nr:putative O-antigen polymerase [Acidobacteriaceae bacterium]
MTSPWKTVTALNTQQNRLAFAYGTIVVFWAFYYFRPQDIFTSLYVIPEAKILGVLALLGLIVGTLGQGRSIQLTKDAKLVFLLFCWFCACVPFAAWRGGAAQIVLEFSKVVIMTLMIGLAVTSVKRLRTLLFIQASATAITAAVGCIFFRGLMRLHMGTGLYGNPNDFAIIIQLNWPICFGFLLATRNPFKKILWATGLIFMLWAVTLTYSRSGFLATTAAVIYSFYEFGVKGKRKYLVVVAGFLALFLLPVLLPSHYGRRLESIVNPSIDPMDQGSAEARRRLLIMSLKLTAQHPIFGVGPGQFQNITQTWFLTHNTYTQLSSETGIPGILLFILLLRQAFRNLKDIRNTERFRSDPEAQVFASTLRAAFVGYLVSAFFAAYGYELFIYALVAFTGVLYNACKENPQVATPQIKSRFSTLPDPASVEVG